VRADDRPFPTVTLDPVPELAGWPIRPVIAVADGAGGWLDATCAFAGLELTVGPPDDHYDLGAAHLVINLDNRDGAWSQYNPDGTPAKFGPGTALNVWARDTAGVGYWLFVGVIGRVDQAADDSVTWEAFDAFSDLAQPVGTLTAGAAGDLPGTRAAAILTAAGRADLRARLALGQNTLSVATDDASPLDQLARAVSSDGGVIWADADGTIRSLDRHWRNGRTDQVRQWLTTDNICDNPSIDAIVAGAVVATTDEALADRVVLENVAQLRAVAGSPTGRYAYTDTDQLWRNQADGDGLAASLFADQKAARLRLEAATLHLFDPNQPNLWQAVDWRIFDRVSFAHRQRVTGGTTAEVAVEVIVADMHHAITPAGGWRLDFGTFRATTTHVALYMWDTTPYTWGDPDPRNVWS
jgi:hypothetical protein